MANDYVKFEMQWYYDRSLYKKKIIMIETAGSGSLDSLCYIMFI